MAYSVKPGQVAIANHRKTLVSPWLPNVWNAYAATPPT